jgi:hypothetical protein
MNENVPLVYWGYLAILAGICCMVVGVVIVGCEKGWWLK